VRGPMIRLGHTAQASGTGRRPTPTTAPRGHREALTREIHGLVERRSQRAIGRTSVSGRKTDQMNQNVTSWSSGRRYRPASAPAIATPLRSEEHTSELQSRVDLVCRLLLEKKKKTNREHRRRNHVSQRERAASAR